MSSKRTITIYVLLGTLWVIIGLWLTYEHKRVKDNAKEALLVRARDISNTVGMVLRTQGRFGMIPQYRINATLEELAKNEELEGLALLNSSGEFVMETGEKIDAEVELLTKEGPHWEKDSVILVNLVDLGLSTRDDGTTRPARRATILFKDEDFNTSGTFEENDPERRGPPPPPPFINAKQTSGTATTASNKPTSGAMRNEGERGGRRGGSRFWGSFRHAMRHMTQDDWEQLRKKRGLHGFILRISTDSVTAVTKNDLYLRLGLGALGLIASLGFGFAWRNFEQTNQLQMRLLQASEMNKHLQELNIAAAGLAHETRNPLNIVRGLAQMVSQDKAASPIISVKLNQIVAEVDRVTGRLNEFIAYSKPLAPKPAPVKLQAVINDVERALKSDQTDKSIRFESIGPDITIMADESLMRQAFFNLLLNSMQAVGNEGTVRVTWNRSGNTATVTVSDDGPGVDDTVIDSIFKPYVTTRADGTGLGLAIVNQVALAHQWEVDYEPNHPRGSSFKVHGLKILNGNS